MLTASEHIYNMVMCRVEWRAEKGKFISMKEKIWMGDGNVVFYEWVKDPNNGCIFSKLSYANELRSMEYGCSCILIFDI